MKIGKRILDAAEDLAVKAHKPPKGYDEATLRSLDEIAPTITCGSALLCSGTAAESRLIEEVDRTDFSHSAMIVKFHGESRLYVWTADTVHTMEDQIGKVPDRKHPGTHLLDLKQYVSSLDRLYPSPDGTTYRYAVARLRGVEVDERKLWSVMYEYDGTPFPPTAQEFEHWLEGQLDIDSGLDNSFCAQMLANTYQKMGWLETDHPPNHYNPGSFAKTEEINKELLGGATLDAPQYFKL